MHLAEGAQFIQSIWYNMDGLNNKIEYQPRRLCYRGGGAPVVSRTINSAETSDTVKGMSGL